LFENKYKKDNNNVAKVIYNGDRILYIFATIY